MMVGSLAVILDHEGELKGKPLKILHGHLTSSGLLTCRTTLGINKLLI